MTESTAAAEERWNLFKADAASVIEAEGKFETAVTESLGSPFDDRSLGRMEAAVANLRAAQAGAIRLAGLQGVGE